jgi:hypothetical protein
VLPAIRRPGNAAAALVGLGLVAAIAAVVLAFVPLSASHAIGFTELWLRPEATPTGARIGVGVGNEEKQATGYILTTRFAGRPAAVVNRVRLDPGEKTVVYVPAPRPPLGGRPIRVAVDLARAEDPHEVYRHVYGWVPVTGASNRE